MGIDSVIGRADALDRQTDAPADWEQTEEQTEQTEKPAGQVRPVDPMEAAANRAEVLLRLMGGAVKGFVDRRLELDQTEIDNGREALAPVIDKYNLAGTGNGNVPYQEEITAGFYLGGLWRRFRRALAELRAADKAREKAQQEQQQSDYGNQREHATSKPAQPVPGNQRLRQEPDPDAPGWDSENWGQGGPVGHE